MPVLISINPSDTDTPPELPLPSSNTTPLPLGSKLILMLVSSPVADMLGALPVAAFVMSNWFTADPVV